MEFLIYREKWDGRSGGDEGPGFRKSIREIRRFTKDEEVVEVIGANLEG